MHSGEALAVICGVLDRQGGTVVGNKEWEDVQAEKVARMHRELGRA